jgi:hypothetical protein
VALVHDRAVGLAAAAGSRQALARERLALHRRGHAVASCPAGAGCRALEAPSGTDLADLVGLDSFRTINDSAGAQRRLRKCRPAATVLLARLGGDGSPCCRKDRARRRPTSPRRSATLRAPFVLDEGVYRLDGSAGRSGTPGTSPTPRVYAAPRAGRGWERCLAPLRLPARAAPGHRATSSC